jgi:hypothetical protein
MKETIYKCKENDNIIKVYRNDQGIDEVHIGTDGLSGWTVIGYKDLMEAIKDN